MRVLKILFEAIIVFWWFGIFYIGALLISTLEAQAKDFGTQGHVFSIIEQDFLEVINAKLKKVDWTKFNQKLQDKTKDYIENPTAINGVNKAKESKEYFYDPTYVLNQDIYDHNGKLIHKAGTKINPLELTSLRESLIFIDGEDKDQVQFALEQYKQKEGKAKIIFVKGSPLKLQRQEKIWIYFDQGGVLTSKLNIQEIPAKVEQSGLKLKINIIATEEFKGSKK
jgi:conjugal transfer pilus assembly protein TraW